MDLFKKDLTDRKLLIIVSDPNLTPKIREVTSELKSVEHLSWQVVTLGHTAFKRLKDMGIPCKNIDSYFFEDDHFLDYKEAIKISNQWFIDSMGNDATIYRGISIGVVLQRSITRIFNDLLSNVRTVERILQEEEPKEIWLCFSRLDKDREQVDDYRVFKEIFFALAKDKSIACKEKILYEDHKKIKLRESITFLTQKGKPLFYSLVVSNVLFFIKYHLMMRKSRNNINIMLPSPQALNYLGEEIFNILLSDKKRNVFIWKGETKQQRVNLIDIASPLMKRIGRYYGEITLRVEKQFIDFLKESKIRELKNMADIVKNVYKRQISSIMRDIISDIGSLEYYFNKMNIHAVLTHADTTIRERTVVSVANRCKVPSIVLQHGAAGHYWGFFPHIATKFAAWGEITERWFKRNGVGNERICITGAANFDSYLQINKKARDNTERCWNGEKDYILYITGIGREFTTGCQLTKLDNEYLLKVILDAVEMIPNKKLVIKLRPGDPQLSFYKSEIKRRGLDNVYLVDITDNGKLLHACGLLLTVASTMAIEALFFGKPIIQLKFVNASRKKFREILYQQGILCNEDGIPLAKYGAAVGVEDPGKLREAIVKIYEDEGLRHSIINNGKLFLRKYCHEPDGKASLRVVECIDELIREVS